MINKRVLFSPQTSETLISLLDNYDPAVINIQPNTEKELYRYLEDYTDALVTFVRNITDDNVFLLGNETRSMFGHLADYRMNPNNKKNLQDAYGHFRRLNLDALKVLCDELDSFFLKYFETHRSYDYRAVSYDFLYKYSDMYFSAQRSYLNAQIKERTGSDRHSGNIIEDYYNAVRKYADLLVFLQPQKKKLTKAKYSLLLKIGVDLIISLIGIVLSIVQ